MYRGSFFREFSEFFRRSRDRLGFRGLNRMNEGWICGCTLRVLRAETWLTVYRTIARTRRAGVFPMESNTKTIAKRARVGPRTQMHVTTKILFWTRIWSISVRRSDMIILDNVLKIRMELMKLGNDNAGKKFYLMQTFSKVRNLVEISKNSENLENLKFIWGRRSCSTSYSSGNLVGGVISVNILMFLMMFCIMSYWFATFRSFYHIEV